MASDNELIIRINGNAKSFLDELDKIQKKTKDTEKVLEATAKGSAIAFAAFAASVGLVTKEFIDYEKALVGVGKTTDINGKALDNFGKEFQKLSEKIPLSTNELLGIAQAAGQLGVKGEANLLKFTETIAKLGVATDLTGEEAATAITRILNVTGEGIQSIDKFGSVIVALGNNFAATESEIVRVTTEVSRATNVFDVSAASAAAIATALKSVGVQAELGGSATGRAFRAIDNAVRTGGRGLERLSELTGVAGAELKKTFAEDSTKVFQLFVNGLGKVIAEGGNSTKVLAQFGLKGDEILKVLPVLAKNSQILGSALELANKETKNATALNTEAEKAYATLGSEVQQTINAFTNLAVDIGKELAPQIKSIVVDIKNFITRIREVDSSLISTIATFLKWGTIITGIVAGFSSFLLGAIAISKGIVAIGAAFLPATVAASSFWITVTGPIGIAVAGIAALTVGLVSLYKVVNSDKEPKTLIEVNNQLEALKRKRDELNRQKEAKVRVNQSEINRLDEQIKKLEQLREAKSKASEDFGTGSLLVNPEVQAGAPLGLDQFGIKPQTIPLSAEGDAVEEARKIQDDLTGVVDKGLEKRLEKLRASNAELITLEKIKSDAITKEEKEIAEKRGKIEGERVAASKIKDEEERQLTLQNIQLKFADELKEIEKFDAEKDKRQAEAAERKIALDNALSELTKEQRDQFNSEDIVSLEEKILTEDEIKKAQTQKEVEDKLKQREQFIADELQFGTTLATIKQFFASKEVQGAKEASAQLIQLTQSKNATLKGIGKAAASANAAIATAEGAIKAYTSLAGIPIVGPALGIGAAAALTAYGIEQQQQILAANTGGKVPSIGALGKDSVPAMLTPNEVIVPEKNYDQLIEAEANARGYTNPDSAGTSQSGNGETRVVLELKDGLMDFIEAKTYERKSLNINR